MTHPKSRPGRVGAMSPWAFALLLLIPLIGFSSLAQAAGAAATKPYDISAKDAVAALKEFSVQSGEQVIFAQDSIKGATTRAIKGEFSATDAIARLLADTGLVATRDEPSGSFAVSREPAAKASPTPTDPNAQRVARTERDHPGQNDLPNAAKTGDEVIRMDAFDASDVSLGRYAEAASTTATKVPTALKELAVSLQILNSNAITDRKAQTVADLYAYVVGMVQVTQRASGFSLRGFDSTSTGVENLQFDGLPGAISEFGNTHTPDVERVEVLKGPNSILYGQLKVGGAVNIVTKSPMPTQQTLLSAWASTYAGTYGHLGTANSYTFSADTTGPIDQAKHWLYRVIVEGQNNRLWRPSDFERNVYLYPSLTYRASAETSFTVKLELGRERRHDDDGLSVPLNNLGLLPALNTMYQEPTDWRQDSGQTLSTQFKTMFAPGWYFNLQTRTLWHTDSQFAMAETNTLLPTITPLIQNSTQPRRYRQQANSFRWNTFDTNAYKTFGSAGLQQTLIVGVGGGDHYVNNTRFQKNTNAVNFLLPNLSPSLIPVIVNPTATAPRSFSDNVGLYAMDQVKIAERLHLVLGSRSTTTRGHSIDPWAAKPVYTGQKFDAIVNQLGAIFDVTPLLSIYGNWSQSFYPNSLTAIDASGNVGFAPERGRQYEAGLKFETPDIGLRTYLAAYDIEKTNVLINTGAVNAALGLPISRLDGGQKSHGVELETEWFPVKYWELQAGVAYNKAYVSATTNAAILDKDLISAPRYSGNFWMRYNVPQGALRGLGAGLGIIYVGRRYGGDPGTVNGYPVESGYFRFDTGIYYKRGNYSLALNVQNALDRKYIQVVTNSEQVFPGDPRKLTLSIDRRF